MATTPTPAPVAPVAPAPAPVPATTLSPTRRRTARPAPPARMVYTRYATAGDKDDRIVNSAWNTFKTIMVFVGGALFFLVFGALMFTCGVMGAYRTHPSTQEPQIIERVIERPTPIPTAPTVQPTPIQPPAPAWSSRWPSREDCEYSYKVELHQAPAGRCD